MRRFTGRTRTDRALMTGIRLTGEDVQHEIFDIIGKYAEKDRTDIRDKALAEAENIRENARSTADERRESVRQKIEKEADRIRERKYNTIRFHMNARRYELKSASIESLWIEAEELVRKAEQGEGYDKILEALFFECIDEIPDGSVVRANPADISIVRSCIARSKRTVTPEESDNVHGGVEFVWPGGEVVLHNTLSYRLSRLRTESNAEISSLLFASEEGSHT